MLGSGQVICPDHLLGRPGCRCSDASQDLTPPRWGTCSRRAHRSIMINNDETRPGQSGRGNGLVIIEISPAPLTPHQGGISTSSFPPFSPALPSFPYLCHRYTTPTFCTGPTSRTTSLLDYRYFLHFLSLLVRFIDPQGLLYIGRDKAEIDIDTKVRRFYSPRLFCGSATTLQDETNTPATSKEKVKKEQRQEGSREERGGKEEGGGIVTSLRSAADGRSRKGLSRRDG